MIFRLPERLLFALAFLPVISVSAQQQPLRLWYKQPAVKWTDALPIGNGRLGAMIFGGVGSDRLQFNEQSLWTGGPRAYQRNGAVKYLSQIRQLLFEGRQAEAESLAQAHFMGMKSHEQTYAADSAAWVKRVSARREFAAESLDDSSWKSITMPQAAGWETVPGFEGLDGAVWLRISFELPAGMAGKKMMLDIGRVRDMDLTYVNGKLIGSSANTASRHYHIPAGVLHPGKNTIAVQVINFFDKGGLTTVKEKFAVYPEGGAAEAGVLLKPEWKYRVQDDDPPALPDELPLPPAPPAISFVASANPWLILPAPKATTLDATVLVLLSSRSAERRDGPECRSRWSQYN